MKDKYDLMFEDSEPTIEQNKIIIDPNISNVNDNRIGITLILRPSDYIVDKIEDILKKLKLEEPSQYYYPNSDIHVTVLSVISCSARFKLETIDLADYHSIIANSLSNYKPFEIKFSGITATKSCIMIQGFPIDNTLNNIRDSLRKNFNSSNLKTSFDVRYKIDTAHMTVLRFKEKLSHPGNFLHHLKKLRNYNFGTVRFNSFDFVQNDWYMQTEKIKLIQNFRLD